jgi:hypothetical protein
LYREGNTAMLKEEFEKLTGIFPSEEIYRHIEHAYYAFEGTKQDFCKAYKNNMEGISQKIQFTADQAIAQFYQQYKTELLNKDKIICELSCMLERELEWQPYIDTNNVCETDYAKLKNQPGTRILSDDEAKELLYNWYGFAKEKILILHSVPVYEINRHHQFRIVGETEREPLYNATDWNYIRFDCGCMCYELENDNLQLFVN